MNQIVQRLILATARGPQQLSFLNELVTSRCTVAKLHIESNYGAYYDGRYVRPIMTVYGEQTKLTRSSWLGLRKRLVECGFVVDESENHVTLYPGLNSLQ